jgi:hypothetical protein
MSTSTVQHYLENKLKNSSHYSLSDVDTILIKQMGIEEFIYIKLTSKKYRKWALSPDQKTRIKSIIHDRVSNNLPILFTYPFGGYKLWRLPVTPEVDWAEFFSVAYFLEYLSPIAASYPPGFEFQLISDEAIIERMNNIPKSDTDLYTQTLQTLLAEFQKYTPENAKIELRLVRDLYTPDEFEVELAKLIPKDIDVEWENQPDIKKERRLKMSAMNIKMEGKEKWNELNEYEQNKLVKKGSVIHDAYISLPRRVVLAKGPDKIIIFAFSIPGIPCIAIGSTKSSVNKFWTGIGVLEQEGENFKEKILSPTQVEKVGQLQSEKILINLIPLKNLQTILVFKEKISFEDKS